MPGAHLRIFSHQTYEDVVGGTDVWVGGYYNPQSKNEWWTGWHLLSRKALGVFGVKGSRPGAARIISHERWEDGEPVEGWTNSPNPCTASELVTPNKVVHWKMIYSEESQQMEMRYDDIPNVQLLDFHMFSAETFPKEYAAYKNMSTKAVLKACLLYTSPSPRD